MKTVWIRAENDPNYDGTQDWHHTFTLSTERIELTDDEKDDFIDILEVEINDDAKEFYMVLHFFENYFNDTLVFDNLAEATKPFYDNISTRQEIRNEDEIQVIEKSYNGEIASSIYETSYSYNEKYVWPDKSTRWILKRFDLTEIE